MESATSFARPMHYWLVAASYKILGQNEFATRLPVALAMIGMVLLTFEFGRRFFGQRAGLYAALAVATSAGMFIFTRVMIPEAIYALAFEGIFYLFLRSWSGSLDSRIGYWGAAALCGIAVMTRALIGVLFPAAAIVALHHHYRRLAPMARTSSFLQLCHFSGGCRPVACPGRHCARQAFSGLTLLTNISIARSGTRLPHDYGAVPLGYLVEFGHFIWLFPWSFFFPLAFRNAPISPRAWREARTPNEQARLLLFVWAGMILLFFTLEGGSRMEYYSFGAWPAIALLMGFGIAQAEVSDRAFLEAGPSNSRRTRGIICRRSRLLTFGSLKIRAATDLSSHLAIAQPGTICDQHGPPARPDIRNRLPTSEFRDYFFRSRSSSLFLLAWILRERGNFLASEFCIGGGNGWIFHCRAAWPTTFSAPRFLPERSRCEIGNVLRPDDQIALYGDIRVAPGIAFYSHRNVLLV